MGDLPLVGDQLLATKLFVPAAAHTVLPRPQLTALLDQGQRRPLTLVSAPAGFGKTTLAATWAAGLAAAQIPAASVAWLSLDEDDNDPERFWRYVITALDLCRPGLLAPFLERLTAETVPLTHTITAIVNALLETEGRIVLVIDDYHLIADPTIQTTMAYLVEHLPPQLHLLLLTRADPPLPLARLRARAQVLELRADQLRCDGTEAGAFLRDVMGVDLPSADLARVAERTEGWLVGLQLLGLGLKEQPGQADLTADLAGTHYYIVDYLTDEVLGRLPREIHGFLLRTAILDRMSAPLCDELLGRTDSQAVLETLVRENIFVTPLDAQRRWYRYHALFAEALRSRLLQLGPEVARTLHVRAGRWFAASGFVDLAVSHALQGKSWEDAADSIEGPAARQWGRAAGERRRFQRWIQQLPAEVVRSRPRLCLIAVQSLINIAPPAEIEEWLVAAERGLSDEPAAGGAHGPTLGTEERANLRGEIAAVRAYHISFLGEAGPALALCREALALLAPENYASRALVAYVQTLASYYRGDAAAAVHHSRESVELALQAGDRGAAANYLSSLPLFLILHGRLRAAWETSEDALRRAASGELAAAGQLWSSNLALARAEVLCEWGRAGDALVALTPLHDPELDPPSFAAQLQLATIQARIASLQGDLMAAQAALAQVEQLPPFMDQARTTYAMVDQMSGWLSRGDIERAERWSRERVVYDPSVHPLAADRQGLALVLLSLARRRPDTALAQLAPLVARAEAGQQGLNLVALHLAEALAHQQRGDVKRARAPLAAALRIGEREGVVRSFVEMGEPLLQLLEGQGDGPESYVGQLAERLRARSMSVTAGSYERTPGESPGAATEPLSARELEVLRMVAAGASNQAIADALVLSVNTAKRHVGSILAKLAATNRTQAVARARALGLIQDEA